MTKTDKSTDCELVDVIVAEFEKEWRPGQIELIDQKLKRHQCNDPKVIAELIRVDLELNWRNRNPAFVEDYRNVFPTLDRKKIEEIAFEEYRCRHACGDPVDRSDYSKRLGIDSSRWPTWDKPERESAAPEFPRDGETFLNFEILGVLGSGAVGRVYLAKQKDLAERLVVIKVTTCRTTEPDNLAQLQHTNIVPIYSVHQTDDFQVICMPFLGIITLRDVIRSLEGGSTADRSTDLISTVARNRLETVVQNVDTRRINDLGRRRDLDLATDFSNQDLEQQNYCNLAAWLIARVAEGLAHAHDNGILHGDIKPENILLQRHAEPLLLDFHLARQSADKNEGPDGGTIPYMAPEHLASLISSAQVDQRSDLYSAGVLLFELLTGETPVPVHNRLDDVYLITRLEQIRNFQVDDDSRLREIPTDLTSILKKCLAADPDDRYQHARELAVDLNRHLQDLPLIYAPNRSIVERGAKWLRRNRWATSISTIISLLVITVVSVGLVGWSYYSHSYRLEKISQSREFVQRLRTVNLGLSSIDHRDSRIDRDIKLARELLTEFNADSLDAENRNERVRILPSDILRQEKVALSRTHYWLAENLIRKVLSQGEQDPQVLEAALNHNRIARQLVDGNHLGLAIQRAEIQKLLGQETEPPNVTLVDIERADGSDLIELAHAVHTLGQTNLAHRALDEYLEQEPANYAAWLLKGNLFASQQRLQDAEACYTVCIGLDHLSSLGYFYRGMTRMNRGEYQMAEDDFRQADLLNPDETPTLLNHALCQISLGKLADADRLLSRALEDPAVPSRVYFIRSQVRNQLGQGELAEQDYRRALELRPSDEISWISRGFARVAEDPQGAIADFQQALRINPRSTMALQNIAAVYAEKLNDLDRAIEFQTELLAIQPENAAQLATRGVLYARNGDRERALNDAVRALEIQSNFDIFYRVAGIYAQTSSVEKDDAKTAVRLLARAALENPFFVDSMFDDDVDLNPVRENPQVQLIMKNIRAMQRIAIPEGAD